MEQLPPEPVPAAARLHLEPAPDGWRLWIGDRAVAAPRAAIVAWAARQPDPVASRIAQLLARIERPAAAPVLMGIVNVTPDSFSDGGATLDPGRAIEHGLRLAAEGAAILDVGGESTRPGAVPVDPAEELRRVAPVVRALSAAGHRVSIDTRNATVMRAAIEAGATLVNDVSALGHDPQSVAVVGDAIAAGLDVCAVLMHMQGEPATMQAAPRYDRPAFDVFDWLEARIQHCVDRGIPRDRLLADPGLGFGKHGAQNIDILRRFALYRALGVPVVLGASRKGLIGAINRGWPAQERVPAGIAAALHAFDRGTAVLRVHDVAATRQALLLWQALREPDGREAA